MKKGSLYLTGMLLINLIASPAYPQSVSYFNDCKRSVIAKKTELIYSHLLKETRLKNPSIDVVIDPENTTFTKTISPKYCVVASEYPKDMSKGFTLNNFKNKKLQLWEKIDDKYVVLTSGIDGKLTSFGYGEQKFDDTQREWDNSDVKNIKTILGITQCNALSDIYNSLK